MFFSTRQKLQQIKSHRVSSPMNSPPRCQIISTDKFVSISVPQSTQSVVISRKSGTITLQKTSLIQGRNVINSYGIIGIFNFSNSSLLAYISKCSECAVLPKDMLKIYHVTGVKFIPIETPVNRSPLPKLVQQDNYLKELIQSGLSSNALFFSPSVDLTRKYSECISSPDAEPNPKFYFNHSLVEPWPELIPFATRLMWGFARTITSHESAHASNTYYITLISRRSIYRIGTRYNRRGIDSDGHVANFVETEQICWSSDGTTLHNPKKVFSFIQIRGSMPFYWSQRVTLKYAPPVKIASNLDHTAAFKSHISSLGDNYGPIGIINLIDTKKSEGDLANQFHSLVLKHNVKDIVKFYIHFDFHKECSKMRWHRLDILMQQINKAPNLKFSFSTIDDCSTVSMPQVGTYRTNCMDNLDRTNVVQSILARQAATQQFSISEKRSISTIEEICPDLESKYKNLWADNADFMSIEYSGTPALKTDFTRTGKRTLIGKLNDGYNSVSRYILNNFFDGVRQDSLDLIVGNFRFGTDQMFPTNQTSFFFWFVLALILFPLYPTVVSLLGLPLATYPFGLDFSGFYTPWAISTCSTFIVYRIFGKSIVSLPSFSYEDY